ncbi:MAG TPA: hypothetical protein VII76_13370 [Acidimicrobiales bacterium]
MSQRARRPRRSAARWCVHLGLIVTASVSLVFETVLTIHIVVGLVFVALVVVHLFQRRRTSVMLAARLGRFRTLQSRGGRLALADAFLALVTAGMLVSGFWDWSLGHPTRIRWHAVCGIVLAVLLGVHTVRRRARLRSSQVR